MGTAIGPVFTYLLAQLPAAVHAVDANALISDGYPITFPTAGAALVGVGAESTRIESSSGSAARAYVELGAQHVNEDFSIPFYVAVAVGGNDQAAARNPAIATFDAICALIASDLSLGGALKNGRWAEIGPVTVTQTPPPSEGSAATGRWCVISASVHCLNNYQPA